MTPPPALWICGDTLIDLHDVGVDGVLSPSRWSWDSRTASGLTADQRVWFLNLDEVKPVVHAGEACVLVCSSGAGGVALLRRRDQAPLLVRPLVNAHSAEVLDGGWVAMAGSDGSDRLVIVEVASGREVAVHPLPHGHGAVAVDGEGVFWVSEWEHVRRLRWADGVLREEVAVRLPTTGAHDLMPDPRSGGLVVTTDAAVWHVDPRTLAVSPFVPLLDQAKVKSVSIDDASGWWCSVQGDATRWWSECVRIVVADGSVHEAWKPGRRLYKARWDRPCRLRP